jgi:hypothetical protein
MTEGGLSGLQKAILGFILIAKEPVRMGSGRTYMPNKEREDV